MSDKDKDAKTSSIAKTLNKVEDRLEKGENCSSVAEGLANVAKASELLSSVWTLPPSQLLRFHHDTRVAAIDGDSTPGFDGNKDDAERFIAISSSEIARYQRLMYANGVKGSRRRLLIILQGMDASGKGGIVRHVFSQGDPMGMHYHGFGAPKGEEKDRDLERDPDRNPPEVVPIGRLLDTFKGGMSEQECLMYGIPLRRESYNDSQNFSIKTAMVSDGVVWHGIISLYKDAETNIIGLSLTTPLSEGALEKLFSALSGRAYKHVALGDDGPVYMDDPILSPDPAVRKEAIRNMLAQLTVPNADPYDTHFEPDSPECREKDAKKEQNEAQAACKELSADIRIAPGSDRIELFLQEGEESAE